MTTLYDTIQSYLNTNWNIAGETKPVFKNKKKVNVDTFHENVVGIEVLTHDYKYATLSKSTKYNTLFFLHCVCATEALRDKYIAEVEELMKAQTSIVGWWAVKHVEDIDRNNFSYTKITCEEHKIG